MTRLMPSRKWLIAALAVASLQTAAIGWMVFDRIQLLRNGREIVLPVVPVDPRSLFRGDYVILSYDAQRLPQSLIGDDLRQARPSRFYVTLAEVDGTWKPVSTSLAMPSNVPKGQVVLKGKLRFGYWPPAPRPAEPPKNEAVYQVAYGLESYFVAEGKGGELEQLARDKKLSAVVAVDAKGNAAIKGLGVDGKIKYDEPLL